LPHVLREGEQKPLPAQSLSTAQFPGMHECPSLAEVPHSHIDFAPQSLSTTQVSYTHVANGLPGMRLTSAQRPLLPRVQSASLLHFAECSAVSPASALPLTFSVLHRSGAAR
jgi:hypothetical protein